MYTGIGKIIDLVTVALPARWLTADFDARSERA